VRFQVWPATGPLDFFTGQYEVKRNNRARARGFGLALAFFATIFLPASVSILAGAERRFDKSV
jgi:hypothetical protein